MPSNCGFDSWMECKKSSGGALEMDSSSSLLPSSDVGSYRNGISRLLITSLVSQGKCKCGISSTFGCVFSFKGKTVHNVISILHRASEVEKLR